MGAREKVLPSIQTKTSIRETLEKSTELEGVAEERV